MNILRIFAVFMINFFVLVSLSIRFIGTPFLFTEKIKFQNYDEKNQYFKYKKIAMSKKKANIYSIVLIPEKNLKMIPIFKTAIGKIFDNQTNNMKIIDSNGSVYEDIANEGENLVTVDGNYKKWPEYYSRLSKLPIFNQIYHITIYEHTCDIWVLPGLLIQLDENIENLQEFFHDFPNLFIKGKLIDLRCTKRVGISNIPIPKTKELSQEKNPTIANENKQKIDNQVSLNNLALNNSKIKPEEKAMKEKSKDNKQFSQEFKGKISSNNSKPKHYI